MVDKNDGSEGLKFNASHLMQTIEEVARAFIAAASAATVQSTRPSVVYSSREECGSPMQRLQQQFSKILKGSSNSPEVSGPYNPEVLTTQKRQWSRFQLKSLVLFAYPLEKPLPLKYKDILSFSLPGGVQVHAVERTPSFSDLNEILLGQEKLKESNQSFVFRLQVADDYIIWN